MTPLKGRMPRRLLLPSVLLLSTLLARGVGTGSASEPPRYRQAEPLVLRGEWRPAVGMPRSILQADPRKLKALNLPGIALAGNVGEAGDVTGHWESPQRRGNYLGSAWRTLAGTVMTCLRTSSRRNSWGHKGGRNLLRSVVLFLVSATLLSNRHALLEWPRSGTYEEPFRPQFHLTPPKNWMNDPNGPVYNQGGYHVFYQLNPFGNEWGHMSRGHAVSPDLIHWRNLPVAIPEQNGVMIFSGSAAVDWNNSSGLCTGSGLPGPSCLVAIYTGSNGKVQNQNLAYSYDRGRTWTKYSGNPILDLHRANFRDPKVFWYRPGRKWVMVVALSDQHQVRFYASEDLIHWAFMSNFGPAGATGGVWECPDLFELPVENRPGERRWVLSVNVNPGSIAGGSGDQYFVGEFDGSKFMNYNSGGLTLWADYRKDFYASTSFSTMPPSDGRRVWLGWLDNWEYAARVPTSPWRGQQSLPRVLKLRRFPQGVRLVQSPVAELHTLRGRGVGNPISLDGMEACA